MSIIKWFEDRARNEHAMAMEHPSGYWKYREKQAEAKASVVRQIWITVAIMYFSAFMFCCFAVAFNQWW
jgi:hypothetical protein